MENSKVLEEIVKAREAIRRKHLSMKMGEESAQLLIKERLKPLIEPLEKMAAAGASKNNLPQNDNVDDEEKKWHSREYRLKRKKPRLQTVRTLYDSNEFNTALESDKDDDDEMSEMEGQSPHTDFENTFTDQTTSARPKRHSSPLAPPSGNNNSDQPYSNYLYFLRSPRRPKNILDVRSGVRRMADGALKIGNTSVIFDDQDIILNDAKYTATPGLIELLFKKEPMSSLIQPEDVTKFAEIMQNTNAYRKNYKRTGKIRDEKSLKIRTYIKGILKEGHGLRKRKLPRHMLVNNSPIQFTYWDDPNELVERLKLLIAERNAGNSSHENEILSILEELREANIIY